MKKTIALILVLAAVGGLLCGCGPAGEEMTTIELCEVAHSVFYAPLYAAMDLGYFAEEGIEIELTNGGGADKVMTAVLTGQADIGLAGPEACIYVQREGREDAPKVFAQLTRRDGAFLVGRTGGDFSWEDLRGKYIIGGRKGGVPEMTLEYVMKEKGVIPHVDATVDTSVAFNMMAGAFTGGLGDYVALFEPTATETELAGQGYVLASIGAESGEIPYTAFFAAESLMKKDPDLILRFTRAVARGLAYATQADPADVAAHVVGQFPDTGLDVLTRVAARYQEIDAWNETPVMKQEAFERLQDVMAEAGELDVRADFAAVVDNSFAKKVSE